jgi:hypothetical protein
MSDIFPVNMRFSGKTFHFWPQTFTRKVDAATFIIKLRKRNYLVRLVHRYGTYQPYTYPAQRSSDR